MKKLAFFLAITFLSLSAAAQDWAPAGNDIKTKWASEVNPAAPHPEYPRPQMVRSQWQNLNGLWEYAITEEDAVFEAPEGKILVPFAVESSLSGVGKHVGPGKALWYNHTFTVKPSWKKKRVLLHFGAVDWKAEVSVNGKPVGVHTGGYTPFCFDITSALKKSGKQVLTVKVLDVTDQAWQPRGKQVMHPQGIWYTAVTGIWQTVWLEVVPETHIGSYYAESNVKDSSVKVTVKADGLQEGDVVKVSLKEGAEGYNPEQPSQAVLASAEGLEVTLPVENAKLWSAESPYLYGLEISISRKGKVLDKVEGYTALRAIAKKKSKEGLNHNRIFVNGEAVFQFGPLDQGWWPDGLYTAPTDEALKFDIVKTKEWGFNMIRKHIKVEPARWYYWCDVVGLYVWQDMPSIGDHSKGVLQTRPKEIAEAQSNKWPNDTFMGGTECAVPQVWKDNYYKEWGEIIDALKGFACICVWVPFNEGWGQFDTAEAVAFTRKKDPTRLVNEASGGIFKMVGDILDAHHYPYPVMNVFERSMINVLGEYGGIGYVVDGHIWRPTGKNWGYSGLCKSPEEVLERYRKYASYLKVLKQTGCAAAVYTQTTDVELEVNGLMTYDRLEKYDPAVLREINESVISAPIEIK